MRTTRVAGGCDHHYRNRAADRPGPVGALSDIDDQRLARRLGLADVACALGLLFGRPRWPWATTRTVLNLVQAGLVVRRGPRGPSPL